jgi:2-aminoadipate transaminase
MTIPTALSASARRVGDSPISELMARALANPDLISLAAGFVDHASLPVPATAAVTAAMLADESEGRRALQYGTTRGDKSLRRRLVSFLERDEAVEPGRFDPLLDRVLVTTGSQQLLYLVAEALVDPGDIVLVESPTYFVFLGVLQAFGARVVGVDIDEGGLRLDALEARLEEIAARGELDRVKLIYTVSEHSNPTGLSLESERRGALVRISREWSRSHRIYILEDAAYRGLTYEGGPTSSVWYFDTLHDTVILARTFSKTFSPGLKMGFGLIPDALYGPIHSLKGNHDFGSSHFTQQMLERVVAEGHYETQIERLRRVYSGKLKVMLGALAEHFGNRTPAIHWTHPRGGLYVWLSLPAEVDTGRDGAFFARCLEEGVLYVPGIYAYPGSPGPAPRSDARLSFGVTSEPGIAEGIRRMARALDSLGSMGDRSSDRAALERRAHAVIRPTR